MTTAYLSTKLEGDDVKISIRNGKVFELAWPDPIGPNPVSTKDILQAGYGTREKRVENLRINMSTAYGIVLGQCMDYLRSFLEVRRNGKQRQMIVTFLG